MDVRSFPLRHRRIQSSSPQPGPSAFRRGDLLPGALFDTGLEGGGGERLRFAAFAATFGSVICFRNGLGLGGAGDVLLLASASGDGVLITNRGVDMVTGLGITESTKLCTGSTAQAKQDSVYITRCCKFDTPPHFLRRLEKRLRVIIEFDLGFSPSIS